MYVYLQLYNEPTLFPSVRQDFFVPKEKQTNFIVNYLIWLQVILV